MHKNLVVKQADLKDCGACCLLSIIKYYKGYIPLETIREDIHTTKIGSSAFHIIRAARRYGFDASGIKINPDNINDIILPAIAHIEVEGKFNHYVVIYKYNTIKNEVTIMDPAKGYKTVNYNEFQKYWTNVIINLYPSSKLPIIKNKKNIYKLFLDLVPSQKSLIIKLIVSSIIFTLLSIITSFYFKIAMHDITNGNLRALKLIIFLFLGLNIMKVLIKYIRDYYENYLNKNIDLKVMIPFLKHLFLLPLDVINNRTTGEIVTRVHEINTIKDLFSKVFITIFLDLLLGIGSAIVLYNINSKLFLLLLLITIIYIVFGLLFSPLIYKTIVENIECESDFNNEVIEKVDSFLTLKNVHKKELINQKIEHKYCSYLKNTFYFNKLLINKACIESFINEIGLCLVTSVGFYFILKSKLSLIDLITFNFLLVYMFDPLKNIVDLLPKYNYIKASFNKISEFYNLKEEDLSNNEEKFINGDIEINKLNFSYNDYNYILNNLNLTIKKGSKIMFKGHSGCGKSTLCKLLYRLYDLKEGTIKIDRINIKDYKLNTIRKNITYLAQKENLFLDTIYNNIVLDEIISTKEFHQICKLCHVDEIVENKPLRYETIIGNNVSNLSGGQRQRILLARALLKKTPIIMLDESLSEVGIDLEKQIIKDLFKYYSKKTIIYVTHRDLDNFFDSVINFDGEKHESIL